MKEHISLIENDTYQKLTKIRKQYGITIIVDINDDISQGYLI